MDEIISAAVAAVGIAGSVCSIPGFALDRLTGFRLRRRRKKMMGK